MKKAIYMITLLAFFGLSNTANAQTMAGGRAFSLAVCDNSAARAWGYNINGQLGNGTNTNSNVPIQVSGLCPVLSVNEFTENIDKYRCKSYEKDLNGTYAL